MVFANAVLVRLDRSWYGCFDDDQTTYQQAFENSNVYTKNCFILIERPHLSFALYIQVQQIPSVYDPLLGESQRDFSRNHTCW